LCQGHNTTAANTAPTRLTVRVAESLDFEYGYAYDLHTLSNHFAHGNFAGPGANVTFHDKAGL
jgi:hypothetical protein